MNITALDLGRYDLCPAAKKESLVSLHHRLRPASLLICDSDFFVVFGHAWLRECRHDALVEVQCLELTELDAWLLSYHLLDSFELASLYEQLNVWRNIGHLLSIDDLRHRIALPFTLDEDVQIRLPDLFSGPLAGNLERDEIVWQVLFRILVRESSDWPAWSRLFSMARFSRSRQIALMDALEDIMFRDKCSLHEVLEELPEAMGTAVNAGELIWEKIYRLRYPKTVEMEASWRRQVNDLGLPPGFTVKHAPFFESQQVEMTARFADFSQLLSFWDRKV